MSITIIIIIVIIILSPPPPSSLLLPESFYKWVLSEGLISDLYIAK
jgi:hypothetical protein